MIKKLAVLFYALPLGMLMAAPPYVKIPDVSDAVKAAVPPKPEDMKEKAPPELQITVPEEREPLLLPEGETVYVDAIAVEEPVLGPSDGLEALLGGYTGKALSMNDINELCGKVSSYYREKGYMLARAYAPKQNVPAQHGVLRIIVVIGAYGVIDVNNSTCVSDAYMKRFLEHRFPRGSVLTQTDLERTMLLVQRMSGASLPRIALAPGERFGTTNLNVDVPEGKRIEGYVIGDNTGDEPSGKYRLMAGLSWNAPLGIGDQLSFGGMISESAAVKNAMLSYTFPLGYDGVTLALSYAKTNTDFIIGEMPEGTQEILDASKGDSSIYDVRLSYPARLTQLETVDVHLDFSRIQLENRTMYNDAFGIDDDVIPKRLNVVRAGARWEGFSLLIDRMFFQTLMGELSVGNVKNGGPYGAENKTEGSYSKCLFSYTGNLALDGSSELLGSVKLQKAFGKPLDSFEQLTLSGSNGVKVYTDSDFTADTGYFLALEYQYRLPGYKTLEHKLGIFAEHARGIFEDEDYSKNNGTEARSLSDAGIVYYALADRLFFNARWAHVLGGGEAGESVQKNTYRSRLMLTLGMVF